MDKYYVTTAIDYVNALPHIGHAYEKIAADILARYYRLQGRDVFFLTGVDEHGSKVEKAARLAGMQPQQYCDLMSEKFQQAWAKLDLSYNYFIRTTDERHVTVVQKLFRQLKDNGDIYKGSYSGIYCEGCEDYLRERDLDADGNCPSHKQKPRQFTEENYFFCLSKYKDKLRQWLSSGDCVVQPESRRREVLKQLDDAELSDFSVSRSRSSLTWGIPVPDEPEQIIYVWIDALANYLTGVGYLTDPDCLSRYWPADLHLIGKDITKFHAIYWPAILMSAGLPLPKRIFGHGFITVEGQKISKTIGNVVDPICLVETYGADAVRFFLFSATPFDQDGDFSKQDFINKVNAELANNLGNLLNRTLTLVERYCGGKVPARAPENNLREASNEVSVVVDKHIESLEFAKAIEAIFALVDETNKYLNDEKPWALFKDNKTVEGETVLLTALEILRRVSLCLYPFTPQLASEIWYQLGYHTKIETLAHGDDFMWELIPAGQLIRNKGPIFKRIDSSCVD
ncbi:MAG: methionine--tRNA ligase [Candidatus Melainabacteria bacterium]|nr:methionine--tRNA ligase [Candidatus Melainabacteria bacterium]